MGEGRGAVAVGEIDVGTPADKQTDGVRMGAAAFAENDCLEQRGPSETIDVIHVDLGLE